MLNETKTPKGLYTIVYTLADNFMDDTTVTADNPVEAEKVFHAFRQRDGQEAAQVQVVRFERYCAEGSK